MYICDRGGGGGGVGGIGDRGECVGDRGDGDGGVGGIGDRSGDRGTGVADFSFLVVLMIEAVMLEVLVVVAVVLVM